jgi:hypothetical protein
MPQHDRLLDAAVSAQQQREAADAQQRADELRHDAARRKQSAAEYRAGVETRLRRGIHRNDPRR